MSCPPRDDSPFGAATPGSALRSGRREPDESQRGMIAARLAKLDRGRPKENAGIQAISQTTAAGMLNVSRDSVQKGRAVLEHGVPELVFLHSGTCPRTSSSAARVRRQKFSDTSPSVSETFSEPSSFGSENPEAA